MELNKLEDIRLKIKEVIADQLDISIDKLKGEMTIDELDIDSLTFAEMFVNIENALEMDLDLDKVSSGQTGQTTIKELIDKVIIEVSILK
ncbi:acyl carrier protein [Paenibacillus sp. FSL P2-0136]|uniref:acyl carrier protein n=1 Tax=Paenibacillus sp. FSL P2-0136 TaxID=2975317 RepID=UPI0030DAB4C4